MKKIFTLLTLTTLTIGGVNAEESIFFNLAETPTNAQVVTSVSKITATYGGEKSVDKTGAETNDGLDWKADLKQKAFKYTLNETEYKFTHYAESFDNSRGANFSFSANAPVYGGFVKYEPTASGKLVTYFYIPDNKAVVFTEVSASNAEGTNLILSGDAKIYVEDGTNVTVDASGKPDATYKKTVGVLVCELKANNTYYLQLNGSKLGVGGFIFAANDDEPETPAEGTSFKIEGYGGNSWGKTLDNITTPFSFDYSTKTVTMNNLFGSSANLEFNFKQSDPNKDPDAVGTVYWCDKVSGAADGDEYSGCLIDNFNGSLIIKQNDVNFEKLENLKFWPGYNTYMEVTVEGEGENQKKVYEIAIMIGGTCYPWDAATSTWGEATKSGDFVKFITTIPFNSENSGIDNIVTDSVDENAPVEYYNLQGIRLSEPAAGQIVIRRQGSKVSKIIVR